jgi:hypothetical protein
VAEEGAPAPIDGLIGRMQALLVGLEANTDPGRYFLATYLRTTVAVKEEIERGGFLDAAWVEEWDVVFAGLYLDALETRNRGQRPPGPWAAAFGAETETRVPPLRHVLLGMNAHINFDLPQALLASITDEEFDDPAVVARRAADHEHIDSVLVSRVAPEDLELRKLERPGDRTLLDRALTPFNRAGTKRFMREARRKVWHNARVLSAARRQAPEAVTTRLRELEELSRERVLDLRAPGQVLLRLAVKGFGVELAA